MDGYQLFIEMNPIFPTQNRTKLTAANAWNVANWTAPLRLAWWCATLFLWGLRSGPGEFSCFEDGCFNSSFNQFVVSIFSTHSSLNQIICPIFFNQSLVFNAQKTWEGEPQHLHPGPDEHLFGGPKDPRWVDWIKSWHPSTLDLTFSSFSLQWNHSTFAVAESWHLRI